MGGFLTDRRGAASILSAFGLVAVLGTAAVVTSGMHALLEHRQLQAAVDDAARSAMIAARAGDDPRKQADGFMRLTESAYSIRLEGSGARGVAAIAISAERREITLFDALPIGSIRASARAELRDDRVGCILVLSPTQGAARRGELLSLSGCETLSRSTGVPLLRLPTLDPFRQVPSIASGGCAPAASLRGSVELGGIVRVCGDLRLPPSTTLELRNGSLILENGVVEVPSSASLITSRAAVIVQSAGRLAALTVARGATLDLDAPRGGPHAGVALSAPQAQGTSILEGAGSIVGAVHLPRQRLQIGFDNAARCTTLIVDELEVTSRTRLAADCRAAGLASLVDLVVVLSD